MNIWDSVQRGLEKATQEAARIARAQRLRAILDGLGKQIEAQQGAITVKVMDLFNSGQLTQSELLTLCQELTTAQQQFVHAQNELKQIQGQHNQGSQGGTQGPAQSGTATYTPAPPLYQPYDNTLPGLVAPPPPGVEGHTVSSLNTIRAEAPPPPPPLSDEPLRCATCQATLVSGNAFCHNCGTPVNIDASYKPTVRGGSGENILHEPELEKRNNDGAATIRAEETGNTPQEKHQDGGI